MKTERSATELSLIGDTDVQQEDQQHQFHAYDAVHPAHAGLPFAHGLCSHCFCKMLSYVFLIEQGKEMSKGGLHTHATVRYV